MRKKWQALRNKDRYRILCIMVIVRVKMNGMVLIHLDRIGSLFLPLGSSRTLAMNQTERDRHLIYKGIKLSGDVARHVDQRCSSIDGLYMKHQLDIPVEP
jgi:hypothetical protein